MSRVGHIGEIVVLWGQFRKQSLSPLLLDSEMCLHFVPFRFDLKKEDMQNMCGVFLKVASIEREEKLSTYNQTYTEKLRRKREIEVKLFGLPPKIR